MCRPGSSSLILDFVNIGSSCSLRSFLHLDSLLSVYGMVRLDSFLLAIDPAHPGPLLPLQGSICSGFLLLVYGMSRPELLTSTIDFIHFGPAPLPQGFACIDSSPSAFGLCCLGSSLLSLIPHSLDLRFLRTVLLALAFCLQYTEQSVLALAPHSWISFMLGLYCFSKVLFNLDRFCIWYDAGRLTLACS